MKSANLLFVIVWVAITGHAALAAAQLIPYDNEKTLEENIEALTIAKVIVPKEDWLPFAFDVTGCFRGTMTIVDGNTQCAFRDVTHLAVKAKPSRNPFAASYSTYSKIVTTTRFGSEAIEILRGRYGPEHSIERSIELREPYWRRWGDGFTCTRHKWSLSTVKFSAVWCGAKAQTTMTKKYKSTTPSNAGSKSSKPKPKQQGVPRRKDSK